MLSKKTKKMGGGLIPTKGVMSSVLTGSEPIKCTFKRKMSGMGDSLYNKSTFTSILNKATFLNADEPEFRKFFIEALTLKCASEGTKLNAKMCIHMLQCLENKDYNPKTAASVMKMTELPTTTQSRAKQTKLRGGSSRKIVRTQATTTRGPGSLQTSQERAKIAIEGKQHMAGRELLQQKKGEVVFGNFPYQNQQLLRFNSKMWRNLLYACYDLLKTPKKDKDEAYKVFIYFFSNILFPILLEYCNRNKKVPIMFRELSREFSEVLADQISVKNDNTSGFLYEKYRDPSTNIELYRLKKKIVIFHVAYSFDQLELKDKDIDFEYNKNRNSFYYLFERNNKVRERITKLYLDIMATRRGLRDTHTSERKRDKEDNPGLFMYTVLAILGFSVYYELFAK